MSLVSNLKQTLRAHGNSANPIVRYGIRSIYTAYTPVSVLKKFYENDKYRSLVLLRWLYPHRLHQTSNATSMDRYPGIFSGCRDYFSGTQNLRILSFGCSTGEEVLSLRRYFPTAVITGAEINRQALALCRKRKVDDKMAFVPSDYKTIKQHGPFDAIFCMAVLQRTPNLIKNQGIASLKQIYPFEKFDRQISELDQCLNKKGLFVLHHSQYAFGQASVAGNYSPLEIDNEEVDNNPKFDRNSERVETTPIHRSVFVKMTG